MIIALKNDNEITVGISICDSSDCISEKDLSLRNNLPFWKVAGVKDCYVGTKTLSFATELFRYNNQIFKDVTDSKSIIEKFLPKMKKLLSQFNQITNNNDWHNHLIIIKDSKIFRITNYFELDEIDNHVVIGFENFLQGALDSITNLEPIESILTAVRTLNRMKNRQLFPITIFNSKTKTAKVYYH